MQLNDKIAVVTGSASGIGKATAKLLAERGATVVIADINREKGLQVLEDIHAKGGSAKFIQVDVSDNNQVLQLYDNIEKLYGRVDILCNNAGIGLRKTFHTVEEHEWETIQKVNLKSVFLLSKYAIPLMIDKGGGSIVNISSVHAYATEKLFSVYASTKGAINALTRGMALDYVDYNIRVNAVVPGNIYTEHTEQMMKKSVDPNKFKRSNQMQPMGRPGNPDEVAQLIVFLSSNLSSYITGSCFHVDGGLLSRLVNEIS